MRFSSNKPSLMSGLCAVALTAMSATAGLYQNTYTASADFELGVLDGVNATEVADQLQLNKTATTFPFAWIANSGEGTVSKIDTQTGVEVARYQTGPNGGADSPSRTAVDVDGNCWGANRAYGMQGTVVKIMAEGGVNTSTGPGDVKAWGTDDRVVLSVNVGGWNGLPRSMAIDKDGYVWVGLFNEQRYAVLDPTTGAEIASVPVQGINGPYGAAIDKNGILWSACLYWGLDKVDTVARTYLKSYATPYGGGYGVVVDANGYVWLGAHTLQGVYRFDPVNETFQYCLSGGYSSGRGVCVAPDGDVWMALGYGWPNNLVAKYDGAGNLLATYQVGSNPSGVGTDSDGNIIVVCQDSWDVYKLNEADGSVMWRTPVGVTPYTYSDFTGYILRNITKKTGTWTVIFDSGVAGTPWGKAGWNSLEPADTSVAVQVRSADTIGGLDSQTWLDVVNDTSFGPINGQFIQIKARLTTGTDESPILYDLTIQTANQPPDCSKARPSVATLWPANNKFVPVQVLGVTDPDGDPVTITITGIRQDEPVNTFGDGSFTPDGKGVGTSALELRAERAGTAKVPGNGRVYHVFFTASDGRGGECSGEVQVTVPHDMNKPALDGGALYDSTALKP